MLRRAAQDTKIARWWGRRQRSLAPLVLLAPALALFVLLVIAPILRSLALAFYDGDGMAPARFVGLANFAELARDPTFLIALRNNVLVLAAYMLAPALGLALALMLNQAIRGIRLIRGAFLMPFVISPVAVGIIFAWFLNPDFGLLNRILAGIGLDPAAPLAGEGAIFAVIAAGLWPQSAYCMILYLTGLTTLQGELIEAARMDGAAGLRLLWHVVLPQLRAVTFIAVLVCVVSALRSFDLVMVMTGGGPHDSSTVLAYYLYEQTFGSLRFGYGAAIATVLFALMSGIVIAFLVRLLRREAR